MPNESPHSFAHCPSCQGDLVQVEDNWQECPNCRSRFQKYIPSPEQRAESRAAFREWHRVLSVVAELHELGYECTRIVPFVVDTAGGGDWHCIMAPAAMISTSHGAKIAEHIDWWRGSCPPGRDYPCYIGRGWRGYQAHFASAQHLLRDYRGLDDHCLGRDRAYTEWYRAMLRTTEPDGVVYAYACWDGEKTPPPNGMRVLSPEGRKDLLVPLPPPGTAPMHPREKQQ